MWRRGRSPDLEQINLSHALVCFACSDEDAAALNLEEGPCVGRVGPRGGRRRPVASPLDQMYGVSRHNLQQLYSDLTGSAAGGGFADSRSSESAWLTAVSDPFFGALRAIDRRALAAADPIPVWNQVAELWMRSSEWPSGMQLGGVSRMVLSLTLVCRRAESKGWRTYCWEGRSVPEYILAVGQGEESYRAYRRARTQ